MNWVKLSKGLPSYAWAKAKKEAYELKLEDVEAVSDAEWQLARCLRTQSATRRLPEDSIVRKEGKQAVTDAVYALAGAYERFGVAENRIDAITKAVESKDALAAAMKRMARGFARD